MTRLLGLHIGDIGDHKGLTIEIIVVGELLVAATTGAAAGVGALDGAVRFWLMMLVSSRLKASRSCVATGGAAMNMNVWPASSPTSPSLSLTCGEPSLLQKRAWGAVNITLLARRGSDYTSHAASA